MLTARHSTYGIFSRAVAWRHVMIVQPAGWIRDRVANISLFHIAIGLPPSRTKEFFGTTQKMWLGDYEQHVDIFFISPRFQEIYIRTWRTLVGLVVKPQNPHPFLVFWRKMTQSNIVSKSGLLLLLYSLSWLVWIAWVGMMTNWFEYSVLLPWRFDAEKRGKKEELHQQNSSFMLD